MANVKNAPAVTGGEDPALIYADKYERAGESNRELLLTRSMQKKNREN